MTKSELSIRTLIAEIKNEVKDLEKLFSDIVELEKEHSFDDLTEFELRGFSTFLHDYYTGLEKIFIKIANDLNGWAPTGARWHIRLLEQMTIAVDKIRPAIISNEVFHFVRDLLSFRHLFRNIYGFQLEEEKVVDLLEKLKNYHFRIIVDIDGFVKYLFVSSRTQSQQ